MTDYRIEAATKEEWAARALAAEERLAQAVEVLRWYHDQMCEGFCKDLRYDSTYTPEMDDECSGCKARALLATLKSKDART